MCPRPRSGQGWRTGVIITMKSGFLKEQDFSLTQLFAMNAAAQKRDAPAAD